VKVRIIVSYAPRYRDGHRFDFVPPITGIHLAAITPPEHEVVEVVHEQVRAVPIPDRADVDVVAISFFSGFARRAYAVADAYRALGVRVVLGGPHASYWVDEALEHADVVVTGEAERVWPEVLRDLAAGRHERVYRGAPADMVDIPCPRYDLLEDRFVVRRVVQATRGCPFTCSFCSVPDLNPGFRVRPVADVVRDIAASRFRSPWADKVVWFWDDNLLVKRRWAKELLHEMSGLDKWWLTQASIDITRDKDLLDAMERSGCIGIFLGIESLDEADLKQANKKQNKVREYQGAIARLHDRGICVMAGFISGFDDQTPDSIRRTADRLDEIGVDVPFLSVLTPFRGTPLYDTLLREGRILADRDWPFYNGYNVAFEPAKMSAQDLRDAHRAQWRRAFSPSRVMLRVARGARQLRPGAMMLSGAMNGFYGHKRLGGNEPADAAPSTHRIAHPDPSVRSRLVDARSLVRPAPTDLAAE
jgi:radical SAM superfamily enzyme YgiQ (UPF0313 family)